MTTIATLVVALGYHLQLPAEVRTLCLIFVSFFSAAGVGKKISPGSSLPSTIILGVLTGLAVSAISLTAFYLVAPFSPLLPLVLFLFWGGIGIRHSYTYRKTHIWMRLKQFYQTCLRTPIRWRDILLSLVPIILGSGLVVGLYLERSGESAAAPWVPVHTAAFLLFFGLVSTLLFSRQTHTKRQLVSHALLFFIFFSMAAIVLRYGFGFDHHIHEAAAQWIFAHGELLPKTPYYLGQYMLVLGLRTLSGISISVINIFLVPVLAACVALLFSLAKNTQARTATPHASLLLLLAPLPFFVQTTPNNLALVFALAMTSLLVSFERTKLQYGVQLLFALVAVAIHPLIGLPLFLAVIAIGATRTRTLHIIHLIIIGIAVMCITPLALWIFGQSTAAVTFSLPHSAQTFLSLFQHPEWYIFSGASWPWVGMYLIRDTLLPLFLLLAVSGFFSLKKNERTYEPVLVAIMFGLVVSAFILAECVRVKDVISYEAGAYAWRLISLAHIILFPLAWRGGALLFSRIALMSWKKRLAVLTVVAGLITLSWYTTYPTRDGLSRYGGYSVRDADVAAVEFIRERNGTSTDYIVIANQMIGAAAMRAEPFARYHSTPEGPQFYYSIPTGGPLYRFFGDMVYRKPLRSHMENAMRFANVRKAYFVHTNYWYPAADIRDEAKKEADAWFTVPSGEAWIFEYLLPKEQS